MTPEYNVLLDDNHRGSRTFAAPFYREGQFGVVDSIQAVHNAGLLQVPTYMVVRGRGLADQGAEKPTEQVWTNWQDTLGERLTIEVAQGQYKNIEGGLYVVDLQGAGLFMPRPDVLRAQIEGNELKKGAYAVSDADKKMLFGERQAYRFNGRTVEPILVQLFTSYGEFLEASKDPAFRASMPVCAVLRSAEEARRNPSGYQSINVQLNNPDLVIPAGGKAPLRAMLVGEDDQARFGWNQFGSWHDGYTKVDSGRAVVVINLNIGVNCDNYLYIYGGRSLGVAPEALVAREQRLEAQVQVALQARTPFEHNGQVYVPVSGVTLLK